MLEILHLSSPLVWFLRQVMYQSVFNLDLVQFWIFKNADRELSEGLTSFSVITAPQSPRANSWPLVRVAGLTCIVPLPTSVIA